MSKEEKKKSNEEPKKNKAPSVTNLLAEDDKPIVLLEPDEWYSAELLEIESKTGNFGPYFLWKFKILDGSKEDGSDAAGTEVTRIMNATLSPSQDLWKWAEVLMGEPPQKGKNVNLTSYYGEKYRVLIKDKKAKKGEETKKRFQQVDTIKAPKPKKSKEG